MPVFFFYFFAVILVLAGLAVVLARNPLHNVFALVVAVFALASLFILLEAYFVGVVLLLIYAGAVMVFFLFVVMFLNLDKEALAVKQSRFRLTGTVISVALLTELFWVIRASADTRMPPASTLRGTIEAIGRILFTDYLLPFELTSFLLLIAVFGIVSLAQGALKDR